MVHNSKHFLLHSALRGKKRIFPCLYNSQHFMGTYYPPGQASFPAFIRLIFSLTLLLSPVLQMEKLSHRASYTASREWRWIWNNIFLM